MKLSVCVFTFNHVNFIRQTIDSVLMQRANFDFEIVISDDCSTDGTADIVREYELRYPEKIRAFLNEKNLGIMQNNAFAINQCRGEYVALLDGDDYWTYELKLQEQVDFLEANRQYVFCFHDGNILLSNGTLDMTTCCGDKQKRHVMLIDIICDTHIPTFSIVFRRNSLGKFPPEGYFKLKAPDRPVFLLLASQGPGYYLNECWAVYRKHSNGAWTGSTFQRQWMVHLEIYKIMSAHFKHVYDKPFYRCERCVTYILTMALLRNGQYKRAMCFIRKYWRLPGDNFFSRLKTLYNTFYFLLLYAGNRIRAYCRKSRLWLFAR
jgi:glycosyltransferase involved in cell wall biosynthesis